MITQFKDLRNLVAQTDAVDIMVASTGDVENSYLNMDLVPERYNDMRVIGFGAQDTIFVKGFDGPLRGVEFYLDDIGHPSEDDKIKKINVSLPKSIIRKVKKVANAEDMTLDETIYAALRGSQWLYADD